MLCLGTEYFLHIAEIVALRIHFPGDRMEPSKEPGIKALDQIAQKIFLHKVKIQKSYTNEFENNESVRRIKKMAPKFPMLFQIGIIVRNVEEAVKNWEAIGMGPWAINEMSGENPPTTDLTIDGVARHGKVARQAFLSAYGMEIELIEPVEDSPYKQWLDEHGPGIHHIAAAIDQPYEEVLKEYKEDTGKDPWIRGQGIGGLMDFSYLDLREKLGIIVEIYKNIDPAKVGHSYDAKGEPALK